MSRNALLGVIIVLVVVGGFLLVSRKNKTLAPTTSVPTSQSPTSAASSPSAAPSNAMMSAKEVTVEGSEFAFSPSTLSFKQGEKVKLTFKNIGQYPHNLTIADLNVATKTISGGQSDSVEFTPSKGGTFSFVCTVDSHADKGMKGTATVQ